MSRRDEILARLEAITELPWLPWIEGKPDPRPGHTGLARGGDHCVVGASGFEISADPWNAEFIAHAPEDIRALLDENAHLREVLDSAMRGFIAQNDATGLLPAVLRVQDQVRTALRETQQ